MPAPGNYTNYILYDGVRVLADAPTAGLSVGHVRLMRHTWTPLHNTTYYNATTNITHLVTTTAGGVPVRPDQMNPTLTVLVDAEGLNQALQEVDPLLTPS